MLQLDNQTSFQAASFVFPDQRGIDTLYVVVKASFELHPKLQIAEKQQPIVVADEYWGEPDASSIKYASEAHLGKPGTDVVVVGEACAPHGRSVTELDVGLSVAGRSAGFKVFGDRHWKGNGLLAWPGKPKPFLRMPLIYERAFGGMQTVVTEKGEKIYSEPRNPVGRGFKGKRSFHDMRKEPVPNLEDPRKLLSSPRDRPKPVGFGFIAPWWEPRVSYAGTYDESWQKKRAPYLPVDFDPRFFHAAHPDWIFPQCLSGGEPVSMLNLSPRGKQSFRIPKCELSVEVKIADKTEKPAAKLETVLLEPADERMCLVWRATVMCDKKTQNIKALSVSLDRLT